MLVNIYPRHYSQTTSMQIELMSEGGNLALGFYDIASHVIERPTKRTWDADQPQPEVIASLERSLREHSDIWKELAKH